jgi:sporulation protein YlmC with PRC-barrel domain
MRLKHLLGLPVIDPTAARKIGMVTDYQVDPAAGRLAALDIDGVESRGAERVLAQRIRRVGAHAVILTARGGTLPGDRAEVNEAWLDSSTLVGLEVMGDDGNLIGRLTDATLDQDSLDVDAYLLRARAWQRLLRRGLRIQPTRVHACSRELMMVSTGRVKEPATADNESTTVSLRLPLKDEDRLAAPSLDQVQDGRPVGAHTP